MCGAGRGTLSRGSPARPSRGLKRRVVRFAPVQRRADLRGEHEAVLAPQRAYPVYLIELALQVASEGF